MPAEKKAVRSPPPRHKGRRRPTSGPINLGLPRLPRGHVSDTPVRTASRLVRKARLRLGPSSQQGASEHHTFSTECQTVATTPGDDVRALRHSRSHRVRVRWVSPLRGTRPDLDRTPFDGSRSASSGSLAVFRVRLTLGLVAGFTRRSRARPSPRPGFISTSSSRSCCRCKT